MALQSSRENNRIVDLSYLHEVLTPEEFDIDRGYNAMGIDQTNEF